MLFQLPPCRPYSPICTKLILTPIAWAIERGGGVTFTTRKCFFWGVTKYNFFWTTFTKWKKLNGVSSAVWPDWTIYWTLDKFLKPLATINLPKSPTFLCNFCKGVKIYHFSSEIVIGQLLKSFGNFFWSHWSSVTSFVEYFLSRTPAAVRTKIF